MLKFLTYSSFGLLMTKLSCIQIERDEAEMQVAIPAEQPSFKKLKRTKEDISGVGKVFITRCHT